MFPIKIIAETRLAHVAVAGLKNCLGSKYCNCISSRYAEVENCWPDNRRGEAIVPHRIEPLRGREHTTYFTNSRKLSIALKLPLDSHI